MEHLSEIKLGALLHPNKHWLIKWTGKVLANRTVFKKQWTHFCVWLFFFLHLDSAAAACTDIKLSELSFFTRLSQTCLAVVVSKHPVKLQRESNSIAVDCLSLNYHWLFVSHQLPRELSSQRVNEGEGRLCSGLFYVNGDVSCLLSASGRRWVIPNPLIGNYCCWLEGSSGSKYWYIWSMKFTLNFMPQNAIVMGIWPAQPF